MSWFVTNFNNKSLLLLCHLKKNVVFHAQRTCSHKCNKVRVRFAPSPTGFVHLGGLRTAFYNYLFARKHNGTFILRIEDTDQDRVVPGSSEHLIDTLTWAGLKPDEGPTFGGSYGPYIQSERTELYRELIDRLLKKKAVYRCFCTPKRLELLRREAAKNRETIKYDNRCRWLSEEEVRQNMMANKPFTVRLRLKEGPLTVHDLVYGPTTYDLSKVEGDPILVKSDGLPTYHFANVVDDHFMHISHVLRGTEWLVSTPKHLMLYEAFGWSTPQYAHLPLIINKDGTKLSKRHDHIRIDTFRADCYHPETIVNYLTQMGGGFGQLDTVKQDKLYTLPQLVEAFRLETINQNNCRIDTDKLKLLNRLSIKHLCYTNLDRLIKELHSVILPLVNNNTDNIMHTLNDKLYVQRIIQWSLDRIFSLNELTSEEFYFLWLPPKQSWTVSNIGVTKQVVLECLQSTCNFLHQLPEETFMNKDLLLSELRQFHQKQDQVNDLKFGVYMKLLRYALTNLKVGPPVAETIELLGQRRSCQYLNRAIQYVQSNQSSKDSQSVSMS